MEVLNLLKFWKSSPSHESHRDDEDNSTISTSITTSLCIDESETDFDDDSFFELEITTPNSLIISKENHLFVDLKDQSRFKSSQILPIEPILSKPTSPSSISVLKSSPKFRLWSKTKKTEQIRASLKNPATGQENTKFTLKFNLEKQEEVIGQSFPVFTGVNSKSKPICSNLQKQNIHETTSPYTNNSSKRFPKDSVQKYLNLIKPFYVKVSKRCNDRMKLSDLLYVSSPAASPVPLTAPTGSPKNVDGGFKVLSKHLGKSRSASAVAGVMSPAASRRDDSLLRQQDDGIESAILHCKRSFQSSRESSLLSRCTSDRSRSSYEKIITEPWRKLTEDQLDGC